MINASQSSLCRTEWTNGPGVRSAHAGFAETGAFGPQMAAYLSQDELRAVQAQTLRNAKLVVTGLQCDRGLSELSASIPAEKAFIVALQLTELPFHELRLGGAIVHTGYYPKGGVSVFNLEEDPRFFFPCRFHCLHFYVKHETLQALANEAGTGRIDKLSWPHGTVDETVSHLGSALLPALNNPEKSGALFLDHVVLALNMHFAYAYGGMRCSPGIARGGLAPWQERRSKEMMDNRIGERISLRDLAKECHLSISHFAAAFRKSTGESPHRWLLKRRVETAKKMLSSTELAISEIAIACGFADQSHLTRVFAVNVGAPPGNWRRNRSN
jgi:AraC family transcriptional regulator